jgi:hypothetical protein
MMKLVTHRPGENDGGVEDDHQWAPKMKNKQELAMARARIAH